VYVALFEHAILGLLQRIEAIIHFKPVVVYLQEVRGLRKTSGISQHPDSGFARRVFGTGYHSNVAGNRPARKNTVGSSS
jgi:hypothetical protein